MSNKKTYFLILLTTLVVLNRINPYKQAAILTNSYLGKSSTTQIIAEPDVVK